MNMDRNEPMYRLAAGAILAAAFILSPMSARAASPSPLQVVQTGSDRGLRLIKSSLFEGGPSLQQRRDEILAITEEYFDFEEMGRRSLGRSWRDVAPESRQEFLQLFKQLLFNVYVRRIEASVSPTTTTLYDGETVQGRYALVRTRVAGANHPEVRIEYRLLLDEAQWKVYDVVIEGVSLVSNYREQFSSILSSNDFESLLKLLRERVAAQSDS
jgi:phospholipid transport system substrate-binding protein